MATFTGKPFVAGESGREILFEDIGYDWDGAGDTLKLRITNPAGSHTYYDLVVVGGAATSALLENPAKTIIFFPTAGKYKLKGYGNWGSATVFELAGLDTWVDVAP